MAAHHKATEKIELIPVIINETDVTESDLAAIKKDLHLIEAALAADKIIITHDLALQKSLGSSKNTVELLNSITWIDPVTQPILKIK